MMFRIHQRNSHMLGIVQKDMPVEMVNLHLLLLDLLLLIPSTQNGNFPTSLLLKMVIFQLLVLLPTNTRRYIESYSSHNLLSFFFSHVSELIFFLCLLLAQSFELLFKNAHILLLTRLYYLCVDACEYIVNR